MVLSQDKRRQEAALRIARRLCERALNGEDFSKLAETYSHGHMRPYGGLWRPFTPDARSLRPPYDVLDETARRLEPGQVSDPIRNSPGIRHDI